MEYQLPLADCDSTVLCNGAQSHRALACVRLQRKQFPRGFSFTEILFAVMILGIGFIMVAAMFPVAIHQTEASNGETIAASIGRQGNSFLNPVAGTLVGWPWQTGLTTTTWSSVLLPTIYQKTAAPLPPTSPWPAETIPTGQSSITIPGQVWTFSDSRDLYGNVVVPTYLAAGLTTYGTNTLGTSPLTATHTQYLWALVAKNLIQATDPRFAWAAMYKRDLIAQGAPGTTVYAAPAPYAQIILIGVQSRVKPAYNPATDIVAGSSPFIPQLIPPSATGPGTGNVITTFTPATSTWQITFPTGAPSAAENAFVVISDDGLTGSPNTTNAAGKYNGRVYRLGINAGGNVWNFMPGEGPGPSDVPLTTASVLIVGREIDPNNPGTAPNYNYAGTVQDVSVYTTFVQTP